MKINPNNLEWEYGKVENFCGKTLLDKNNGSLIVANSEYKFNIKYDGAIDTDFKLGYKINESELFSSKFLNIILMLINPPKKVFYRKTF